MVPAPSGRVTPPADRWYRGLLGAGVVVAVIGVVGCGGSIARRTEAGQAVFSRECGLGHSLSDRQTGRYSLGHTGILR
jgi:hypothetical protein